MNIFVNLIAATILLIAFAAGVQTGELVVKRDIDKIMDDHFSIVAGYQKKLARADKDCFDKVVEYKRTHDIIFHSNLLWADTMVEEEK